MFPPVCKRAPRYREVVQRAALIATKSTGGLHWNEARGWDVAGDVAGQMQVCGRGVGPGFVDNTQVSVSSFFAAVNFMSITDAYDKWSRVR